MALYKRKYLTSATAERQNFEQNPNGPFQGRIILEKSNLFLLFIHFKVCLNIYMSLLEVGKS